jgi:protein TonB
MDGLHLIRGDSHCYEDVPQCFFEWTCTVKDMDDFLDSFVVACPWVEAGPSIPASFPALLELTADGPVPFPVRKIVTRDLILGVGGALLAHVVVATAILLLPFLQPLPNIQEPLINVYLANPEGMDYNSSGGDLSDGAASAKHSEDTFPEPKTVEKTIAPNVPNTIQTLESVIPKPKIRKTAALPAKTKITSNLKSPIADPTEIAAAAKEPVSQNTGADLMRGEGQGTGNGTETGKGSGTSGPGDPSSGTGLSGEYDAAVVDQAPQVLKKIEPAYPNRARSLGICGKVVVRFLVEPDGRVSRPSVVEARPAGYFEQSALEAIRQWQFRPGCFKGRVVSTWVTLPVQFRLIGQD